MFLVDRVQMERDRNIAYVNKLIELSFKCLTRIFFDSLCICT